MSTFDLDPLLSSETPRVEWKQAVSSAELLKACCALANDIGQSNQPGFLLLGVDKKGTPVGLDLPGTKLDEELQRIDSWLRSTSLWPTPSFAVHVAPAEAAGRVVLAVEVRPYAVPPVVEYDRRAWVRPGTSTVKATAADLARLRERRPVSARPFDSRPIPAGRLDDIDDEPLRAAFAEERELDEDPTSFPDFETWLSVRRSLGEIIGEAWVPTNAAILAYGKSPQRFIPGAFVDVVRYAGEGVDAEVAWRKRIAGTAGTQIEALRQLLQAEVKEALPGGDQSGARFTPDYPVQALEEFARNLVQHRLYEGTNAPSRVEVFDDRIEFSNPGDLFGRASEGPFGTHSDYRNPALTAILVDQGYVRQLGRGIRRAKAFLAKNGNPDLEVEVDGFTRITVRARPR